MSAQQPYQIVQSYDAFEVRRYPAHLMAEIVVEGSFEDAGNRAFGHLFAYLGGGNNANLKVAMTAPVVQETVSGNPSMNSPALPQQIEAENEDGGRAQKFRVSFVLPEDFTIESAPSPTNPNVHLRLVPESLAAVIRYGGRWNNASYQKQLDALKTAMRVAGLKPAGMPRLARFDPPFKPPFMRHNEIAIDLYEGSRGVAG